VKDLEFFTKEEDSDLWDYWITLRRHLGLIVGIFVAVELLTAFVLLLMTPLYTGLSTILIDREMPEVLENKAEQADPDSSSFYRTQYELLKSRSLAAAVITDLRLDKNPAFIKASSPKRQSLWTSIGALFAHKQKKPSDAERRQADLGVKPEIIETYLKNLTIRPEYDTRLAEIAFTTPDPVLSARIANAHVQAFIRKGYELHTQNGSVAQHFLEGELVNLEKRLEKSEEALNDYRRQRGIVTFSLDDQDRLITQRMSDLTRGLVQAEETRIALQADYETINSKDYDSVPAVVNSTLIQRLKLESSRLEGQYASLADQYTHEYPPVGQAHAQLLKVQRREQSEVQRVVYSIKSKYEAALRRENEVREDLEREKASVLSLKDASLRDAILAREVDTNRTLYKNVLERINVLSVASEARVTNVSIVDNAEIPDFASSPKKELTLVLSGFLALLAGIATAFAMEGADKGLKDAEEVERYLRMPNLATVVSFTSPDKRNQHQNEIPALECFTPQNKPVAIRGTPTEAALMQSPFAAASEAYRAIRTGILLSQPEECPKTILFTSATVGEGKSVTAINTAVAFAQLVDRVLLIDADLRLPRCHELLDREEGPGLVDVLTGRNELDEAIQPTAIKGLYLLSAGLSPPNPSELLNSKKMREILASVKSSYEHVLIDSAPILPVTDSVVLSTLVDGVVLVTGRQTAKQAVRDAYSRLVQARAKLLGSVLNNVDRTYQHYYSAYVNY
jgi:capsular exopolysaccharide synthesis family protein